MSRADDDPRHRHRLAIGLGNAAEGIGIILATRDGEVPEGITVTVPKPTQVFVEGIDEQQVGQVASNIRDWRRPEPYKGKGIRYAGEQVRRKVGKRA